MNYIPFITYFKNSTGKPHLKKLHSYSIAGVPSSSFLSTYFLQFNIYSLTSATSFVIGTFPFLCVFIFLYTRILVAAHEVSCFGFPVAVWQKMYHFFFQQKNFYFHYVVVVFGTTRRKDRKNCKYSFCQCRELQILVIRLVVRIKLYLLQRIQ